MVGLCRSTSRSMDHLSHHMLKTKQAKGLMASTTPPTM